MTFGQPAPVPPGRGRWRFTLHNRQYSALSWQSTLLAELDSARGRRLVQTLNSPARLGFTLNGGDPDALLVQELTTDVIAWRWDSVAGRDVPYFRGVVGQAEDNLTEQSYTVNFTCHAYDAMVARRYLTNVTPITYTNVDQDSIVANLLARATNLAPSGGVPPSFLPGAYIPVTAYAASTDGSARAPSGQLRDRTYAGQSSIGELIGNLAAVSGGFDYDVVPAWRVGGPATTDYLRVFYPSQGVPRSEPLEYGGAIATVIRTVDSGDYANYLRVVGNNGESVPTAPQLYGEAANADAGGTTVGLWQEIDSGSDVTSASTLEQQAQGDLNVKGVLVPAYTLGLRPGVYVEGAINIGDTVPIVIKAGRLNINTSVRVVGMTFDIGDDGQEDVALTVGRPLSDLADMLTDLASNVNALARR